MSILIIDDSYESRLLLETILKAEGYSDILSADSANHAFDILGMGEDKKINLGIDLILMDIMMPQIDGLEACRKIKAVEELSDIPIIMVTAKDEPEDIKAAFDEGAIDYITKTFKRIELLARVRSALRLKHEMDWRKAYEQQLLEVKDQLQQANKRLQDLSELDGLTGIPNRRRYDEFLEQGWRFSARHSEPLSLIMVDIDYFKAYNDTYGHQQGDECLRQVAAALNSSINRSGELVARYGGEEFSAVLTGIGEKDAFELAEIMRTKVEGLGIEHKNSSVKQNVTVSLGVATIVPNSTGVPAELIEYADKALYQAKHDGRNRVKVFEAN